jgi:NAD-dependent deacetylase
VAIKNAPDDSLFARAADLIRSARHATVFTGAGISVESGIPPFRGPTGIWTRYDPACLEISYFHEHPMDAWNAIKQIFYDGFERAVPNLAHRGVAALEQQGLLHAVITQNIDGLHQRAGSRAVLEYHGTLQVLSCTECTRREAASRVSLQDLPPTCRICGGLLRPDFVFFGEPIPGMVQRMSLQHAASSDVMLVIGASGEVMPAGMIPYEAKRHGATIIEINAEPSRFTETVTGLFLQSTATEAVARILSYLDLVLSA